MSIEGQVFRHYKGKSYRALGVARHSEDDTEWVVYETLYESGATLWMRPKEMFLEDLETGPRFVATPDAAPGERFLRSWLASWSGNRLENLLGFYHNEVFYSDPAHPQGLKGKAALGAYLGKLLARYPEWKWELVRSWAAPGRVTFVEWEASLGNKRARGLDLVRVQDGLIVENRVFFDPQALFGR